MTATVVITGHLGGLGRAIAERFLQSNYCVIGIDQDSDPTLPFAQIQHDLSNLGSTDEQDTLSDCLLGHVDGSGLNVLINNAACQRLSTLTDLSVQDLTHSLMVNAVAPLVLTRLLLPSLEAVSGTVFNIGSIHSNLTKRGFAAYSISKAALSGISRAMIVEWGNRIRVIELRPAAIATDMLEAGFAGDPTTRKKLNEHHPAGQIGTPEEIAHIVHQLAETNSPFLHGAIVNVDGGISQVLHDPDC